MGSSNCCYLGFATHFFTILTPCRTFITHERNIGVVVQGKSPFTGLRWIVDTRHLLGVLVWQKPTMAYKRRLIILTNYLSTKRSCWLNLHASCTSPELTLAKLPLTEQFHLYHYMTKVLEHKQCGVKAINSCFWSLEKWLECWPSSFYSIPCLACA